MPRILIPVLHQIRIGPNRDPVPVLKVLQPPFLGPAFVVQALDPERGPWWDDLFRFLYQESDYESFLGWWRIEGGILGTPELYTPEEYFLIYPSDEPRPDVPMLGVYTNNPNPGVVGYWSASTRHGTPEGWDDRDERIGTFRKECPSCGK